MSVFEGVQIVNEYVDDRNCVYVYDVYDVYHVYEDCGYCGHCGYID